MSEIQSERRHVRGSLIPSTVIDPSDGHHAGAEQAGGHRQRLAPTTRVSANATPAAIPNARADQGPAAQRRFAAGPGLRLTVRDPGQPVDGLLRCRRRPRWRRRQSTLLTSGRRFALPSGRTVRSPPHDAPLAAVLLQDPVGDLVGFLVGTRARMSRSGRAAAPVACRTRCCPAVVLASAASFGRCRRTAAVYPSGAANPGPPGRVHHGDGAGAWCSIGWLTEPSSSPLTSPRPCPPTTTSWAAGRLGERGAGPAVHRLPVERHVRVVVRQPGERLGEHAVLLVAQPASSSYTRGCMSPGPAAAGVRVGVHGDAAAPRVARRSRRRSPRRRGRSPNRPRRPPPARRRRSAPRATSTGQSAYAATWIATEPTSSAVKPPRPRSPSTMSAAAGDSPTSTAGGLAVDDLAGIEPGRRGGLRASATAASTSSSAWWRSPPPGRVAGGGGSTGTPQQRPDERRAPPAAAGAGGPPPSAASRTARSAGSEPSTPTTTAAPFAEFTRAPPACASIAAGRGAAGRYRDRGRWGCPADARPRGVRRLRWVRRRRGVLGGPGDPGRDGVARSV